METVIHAFFPQAEKFKLTAIKSGKIHQSFLLSVSLPAKKKKKFLLQKINTRVFKEINLLQKNIALINTFYNEQKRKPFLLAKIITTTRGELFFKDFQQNCWRVFSYFEGYSPLTELSDSEKAYLSGQTFAQFILFFRNFSLKLPPTIPDFRNFLFYQNEFLKTLPTAPAENVNRAIKTIKKIEQFLSEIVSLHSHLTTDLPHRLLHNDPKISNLLLSKKRKGRPAIVDLDTVNYGFVWQDFGDLLRSAISGSSELIISSKPDLDLLAELIKGFLSELTVILSPVELESLAFGAELISFELGLRFLTDYLQNGEYFQFDRQEDKLTAANLQLNLHHFFSTNRRKIEKLIKKMTGLF